MADSTASSLFTVEAAAELAQAGPADLAIGVTTAGTAPGLAATAAAIRAGLDAYFPEHSAVVIHIDAGSPDETAALLTQSLAGRRVLRVRLARGVDALQGEADRAVTAPAALAAGLAVGARAIAVVNAELASMTPLWVRGLAEPVLKDGCGLILPVYRRARYEGTLTQTLVTPLFRALFGQRLLHPLAEEFGCSAEAALHATKQEVWGGEFGSLGFEVWLPAATIEARLTIGQAVLGQRALARPAAPSPLGPTVGRVAGALFALAERFESVWLGLRRAEPTPTFGELPEPLEASTPVDADGLLQGFRQGVRDLLPIWERILAPDSLGDVLAVAEPGAGAFTFPDRLWARVVYDFLLAYRMRVMYRTHVAQSLAPLYLGRAASLVLETRSRPAAAVLAAAERLGRVFEEQKPYLVDQWR
jgi:hypothetical protein